MRQDWRNSAVTSDATPADTDVHGYRMALICPHEGCRGIGTYVVLGDAPPPQAFACYGCGKPIPCPPLTQSVPTEAEYLALTVWEPWATLLAIGAKRAETRSWPAPKTIPTGARIAIHAAKRDPAWYLMDMATQGRARAALWNAGVDADNLPAGAVVGILTFQHCAPMEHRCPPIASNEFLFGDWRLGRYGWWFDGAERLPEPIPAVGKQGLWRWRPNTEATI